MPSAIFPALGARMGSCQTPARPTPHHALACICICIYSTSHDHLGRAQASQELGRSRIDLEDLDGFFDGELLTMEDVREPYGEVRFQSVGVFQGVPLFVVWSPRGGDDIPHIISARKAVKHEEQAWQWRYSKRP